VLIANVIEMLDGKGGTKAPDTTLWREHLHAATMVGRMSSASRAVELGYGIEADPGPSGKLGHWKIAGIPDKALAVHSKRAIEISEAVAEKGFSTYQARQVAARETRKTKRHTPVEELLPKWRTELGKAGFPPEQLVADIERAGLAYQRQHSGSEILGNHALAAMAKDVLGPKGTLSDRKVFSKRDVIVASASRPWSWTRRVLVSCVIPTPFLWWVCPGPPNRRSRPPMSSPPNWPSSRQSSGALRTGKQPGCPPRWQRVR
jgi:hypothetical protein